jgi:hypothetical protein
VLVKNEKTIESSHYEQRNAFEVFLGFKQSFKSNSLSNFGYIIGYKTFYFNYLGSPKSVIFSVGTNTRRDIVHWSNLLSCAKLYLKHLKN